MTIRSLRRELERLKELARDERPIECFCRYVEIVDGSEQLTEEQTRILERNRDCYERNHAPGEHTGFVYVEVPPVV
jgi:transposase